MITYVRAETHRCHARCAFRPEAGCKRCCPGGNYFHHGAQKVFGANDRVRVGICGLRGQGFFHAEKYAMIPNVEIAAFCDPDANILSGRLG